MTDGGKAPRRSEGTTAVAGTPARRTGRPSQAEAEKIAASILGAGWRIFVECGVAGFNIDVLAREARVSKRTIYDRFGSKERLLGTVLHRAVEAAGSASAKPGKPEPGIDWLPPLVGHYYRIMMSDGFVALMGFLLMEGAKFPDVEASLVAQRDASITAFADLLVRRTGVAPGAAWAREAAVGILALIKGYADHCRLIPGAARDEVPPALVEDVRSLLRRHLG